mmetsp:Transcript_22100/g.50052  ORF Transcript_22100/g.50052 Transcript_22100/m.50052 type:complete len:319 (+) Transcript_22100:336-1292(+)
MMIRGPHVLTECDYIDIYLPQVSHSLQHLLVRLPQAQHDRSLGVNFGVAFLGVLQHAERLVVPSFRVSHVGLQPAHCLHIVRVNVQSAVGQSTDRLQVPCEVADQALHQHVWPALLDELHGGGEVTSASVLHVVSVHASQHHIRYVPRLERLCCLEGLEGIRRGGLQVRLDGAESAATSARVPQEHDCTRSPIPALADVRALSFLADSVQSERLHRRFQLVKLGVLPAGRRYPEPIRPLSLWHLPTHPGNDRLCGISGRGLDAHEKTTRKGTRDLQDAEYEDNRSQHGARLMLALSAETELAVGVWPRLGPAQSGKRG